MHVPSVVQSRRQTAHSNKAKYRGLGDIKLKLRPQGVPGTLREAVRSDSLAKHTCRAQTSNLGVSSLGSPIPLPWYLMRMQQKSCTYILLCMEYACKYWRYSWPCGIPGAGLRASGPVSCIRRRGPSRDLEPLRRGNRNTTTGHADDVGCVSNLEAPRRCDVRGMLVAVILVHLHTTPDMYVLRTLIEAGLGAECSPMFGILDTLRVSVRESGGSSAQGATAPGSLARHRLPHHSNAVTRCCDQHATGSALVQL